MRHRAIGTWRRGSSNSTKSTTTLGRGTRTAEEDGQESRSPKNAESSLEVVPQDASKSITIDPQLPLTKFAFRLPRVEVSNNESFNAILDLRNNSSSSKQRHNFVYYSNLILLFCNIQFLSKFSFVNHDRNQEITTIYVAVG